MELECSGPEIALTDPWVSIPSRALAGLGGSQGGGAGAGVAPQGNSVGSERRVICSKDLKS